MGPYRVRDRGVTGGKKGKKWCHTEKEKKRKSKGIEPRESVQALRGKKERSKGQLASGAR